MGLTHSWTRPTELPAEEFTAAVQDVRRVLAHINVPLAGFESRGEPIFNNDVIVFNGVAGAGCEPFEIHQVEFDRHGHAEKFSFCKTEGLPYDLAVKAALIVLKVRLGDSIGVFSDESDDLWTPARQLVNESVGYGSKFRLDSRM